MLLEGYAGELTPMQKTFAEKSYESNEREITIINDLLQVAQVDAGKMKIRKKKVNFVTLISEILDEQKSNFADREQKIIYRHNKSKITTNADRDRIRMVLENMIDNASKYTGPQTTITVTLTNLKESQGVQIKIKDEGVGIPKEHISKIFDKFVRIDNSRSLSVGGSGLGLYLVKKIIDLHDGIVKVTSTPGKGTTFTLSLPSAAATTEPTRY
jgi:signal transduction histidine kinase